VLEATEIGEDARPEGLLGGDGVFFDDGPIGSDRPLEKEQRDVKRRHDTT
jgi:hypothetical protein